MPSLEEMEKRLRWVLEGAESMLRAERERAYREGLRQGYREAMSSLMERHVSWETKIREFESEVAHDLSSVVLAALRDILEQEFSDTNRVLDSLKRALSRLGWHPGVRVRVSPDAMEIVHEHMNEIRSAFPDLEPIFEEDESLLPAEVVLETETSLLSITVDEFVGTLRDWLHGHG